MAFLKNENMKMKDRQNNKIKKKTLKKGKIRRGDMSQNREVTEISDFG